MPPSATRPCAFCPATSRGASDTFWYARAESGIKSFKDAGGKTVAYSTNGSSSNLVSTRLLQLAGIKDAKGVPTGNPVATLTQVLSGQIDIGYSLPPITFPEIDAGKLVFVGSGRDVPEFRDQTVRCLIATPDFVGIGVRSPRASCRRTTARSTGCTATTRA